jgi:hypothetical protein
MGAPVGPAQELREGEEVAALAERVKERLARAIWRLE